MDSSEISREQIEFAGLQRVNYSKLPWEEKLTVMWGWFWRSVLVNVGTGAGLGIFLSFFVGILVGIIGNPNPAVITLIVFILAIPLGILVTHPLIQWILSSRIGDYRLILCKKRKDEEITLNLQQERTIVGL